MAKIIRAIFFIFWLAASGFLALLAYSVIQTESDPGALWGWMVMCALSFISASFLAYNIIWAQHDRHGDSHPSDT